MRISDWSSDVCSSDLAGAELFRNRRDRRADGRDGQPGGAGGDPRPGSLWRGYGGAPAARRPVVDAVSHRGRAEGSRLPVLRRGTMRELRIVVATAEIGRAHV